MVKRDGSDERQDVDMRYVVPGLSRGLAMLRLFSREHPELSAADLAAGTGVSRSTAFRLIYTLEAEGLIARTADGRRYALTGEVLGLGFHYLSTRGLGDVAQPFLEELSRRTQLSAYLAILDGRDVVYVAHVPAQTSLVSSLRVGARQAAWSTASGRLLLAALDDAALDRFAGRYLKEGEAPDPARIRQQIEQDRKTGLLHKRSDHDPHMASCAAPVRGTGGEVVAALTAIGPASLVLDPAMESRIEAEVTASANAISKALGARPD
jgi:IclR family pca regulon transcriptional regulator